MKKIYINENFISNVVKGRLLPQFLFKLVKTHTTSLGDNEAFPTSDEYPFDYVLLKERYNEVCDAIDDIGLESLDEDYLMSELSSLVTKCKELETPVRDALEKVCENAVNKLFAIPEESINMSFKLVDRIKFKNAVRMRPESSDDVKYTFKDIADIDLSNKAIAKRRFINALIQGASYLYSNIEGLYIDDIDRISHDLPRLYRKIKIINDYLLFTKKEEMSDDKPMQGSYVETHLGVDDSKTTIKAQGIIFPLLLHEAVKGLFELFSAHGLPQDKEKAQYVIKKADFVLAEPWDLRLGVGLWRMIFGNVEDTNMIPYMFTSFVKIPTDKFNMVTKEILSNTEKGNEIINSLMKDAEYDSGYQQFTNRINARNVDKSLIQDSYFTGAETNGYEIGDNEADGDVIEEDEDADTLGEYEAQPQKPIEYYQNLVQSATLENIDFIEGNVNGATEDLIVTINGEIIPRVLILLMVQPKDIRISETETKEFLQLHIILNEGIQRLGLAPKIYKKIILTFGDIYSGNGRRINDEHISKVYAKLAQDPSLTVFYDKYLGYFAIKKQD